MPRISWEGTVGLLLEIVVGILDHLHITGRFIIWGLFALGILLISDAVIRSNWAASREVKPRVRRTALGMTPVIVGALVFGALIHQREKVNAFSSPPASQQDKKERAASTDPAGVRPLPPVTPNQTDPKRKPPSAPERIPQRPMPPEMQSRVRIAEVLVIAPGVGPFPAINVYYDNAGKVPVNSIANHFAVGFASSELPEERISQIQDQLLQWDGWNKAMAARSQYEMYQGDPGEFTTIPPMEGQLADDFRRSWNDVSAGKTVLYIFIAFKYRDQTMPNGTDGVTEDCFWFSGNFARHNCGRGRSFLESLTTN